MVFFLFFWVLAEQDKSREGELSLLCFLVEKQSKRCWTTVVWPSERHKERVTLLNLLLAEIKREEGRESFG
jgi:hypothetical protein